MADTDTTTLSGLRRQVDIGGALATASTGLVKAIVEGVDCTIEQQFSLEIELHRLLAAEHAAWADEAQANLAIYQKRAEEIRGDLPPDA
jgi:hypothetical protein